MAKLYITSTDENRRVPRDRFAFLAGFGHELTFDESKEGLNYFNAWYTGIYSGARDADGIIFDITFRNDSLNFSEKINAAKKVSEEFNRFLILIVDENTIVPSSFNQRQNIQLNNPEFQLDLNNTIENSLRELKTAAPKANRSNIQAKAPEPQKQVQYWFLKVNPITWNIGSFKVGDDAFFNTHDLQTRQRIDYDNFTKVEKGDIAVGFAFGSKSAVECFFEVTRGVYSDEKLGEGIALKIIRVINPPITLNRFIDQLPFKAQLSSQSPERLFPISNSIYNNLLALSSGRAEPAVVTDTSSGNAKKSGAYLAAYNTEGDHNATEDRLDFTKDIEAFGTTLCLTKVKPPLAIGLFGKWGSGKSFFMQKLSDYIDNLKLPDDDRLVNYVVQVKFNSWHYSDANLWASLITEIFDSLYKYATDSEQKDEINKLSASLQLTSLQKEAVEQKKKELQESVNNLKELQQKRRTQLEDASGITIVKLFVSDPRVKADVEQSTEKVVEGLKENQKKLDEYIAAIRETSSQVKLFFSELTNFKGWRIWSLVFFAALIFAARYVIANYYATQFATLGAWISIQAAAAYTVLGKMIVAIKPYRAKLIDAIDRLTSLKKTLNSREQVSDPNLNNLEKELLQLTGSLTEIDQKIASTEKQIADITSGKKLLEFISDKVRDENYNRQLGLIAWIRKDFETLDQLLRAQHMPPPDNDDDDDKQRAEIFNPQDVKLKIDRIILYIDDLDRCNEDIVVKVLEAIHLLLAFPLFVVVVGVDPRWLNNALQKKYSSLFRTVNRRSKLLGIQESITSFDYLEKIFQIPFALKPINKLDRKNLLSYLTKNELQTLEPPPDDLLSQREVDDKKEDHNFEHQTIVDGEMPQKPGDEKKQEQKQRREEKRKLDDNKKKIEAQSRLLSKVEFSTNELLYLEDISGLFGRTPRMINRYINIYRIIKSHESYNESKPPTPADYKATMLVLGVILGAPDYAQQFVEIILNAPDAIMNNFRDEFPHPQLKNYLDKYLSHDSLHGLTTAMLKANMPLISRFSFRTHMLETEEY